MTTWTNQNDITKIGATHTTEENEPCEVRI